MRADQRNLVQPFHIYEGRISDRAGYDYRVEFLAVSFGQAERTLREMGLDKDEIIDLHIAPRRDRWMNSM